MHSFDAVGEHMGPNPNIPFTFLVSKNGSRHTSIYTPLIHVSHELVVVTILAPPGEALLGIMCGGVQPALSKPDSTL